MTRHLQSCKERFEAQKKEKNEEDVFLFRAGGGPFWVYFEVPANSTLEKVDSFLRELWLECCGHLSAFTIDDVNYASSPQKEYDDRSMRVMLKNVLRPGMSFVHEYDFGTTTRLGLKCVSVRKGSKIKGILVLARNNLPKFECSICRKPAQEICTECAWQGNGLLCAGCAKKHECGEDMLLPVVNSPRMGMCGFTG
ncbi:MAG: hypothetical protein ABIF10_00085 [Candidatus Woesearchaeota archaeon]